MSGSPGAHGQHIISGHKTRPVASISPLCSPPCKPVSSNTSPLPSRATHSSPGTTAHAQEASAHRKHSNKSLSQPTIPEEGPEQTDEVSPTAVTSQSITDKILATFKPADKTGERCKHEGRGAKGAGGSQEAARSAKETRGSQADTLTGAQGGQGAKVTKSGSFKEERLAKEDLKTKSGSDTAIKSPKLSRAESMTERTVQKISKMVRGTSRSESRSKKYREPSSSPSKCVSAESEKEKSSVSCVKPDKAKEEKRSAQEKREMFKSKQKEQ